MFNYLKNIILFLVIGLAAVNLAACATDEVDPDQTPVQIVVPQDNAQKQKLYDYLLNEQGINVVKVGETRTIVIASDRLFIANSANFNADYAKNLRVVAQLIGTDDTTQVAVTAYTDQSGDVAKALTDKQAQKIMRFLQKNGADTRLIFAKGYGNMNPVTLNKAKDYYNRRVEIKFQVHQE
jgi:outer membrane protein OmpA-like peptidoglycan-associated protein